MGSERKVYTFGDADRKAVNSIIKGLCEAGHIKLDDINLPGPFKSFLGYCIEGAERTAEDQLLRRAKEMSGVQLEDANTVARVEEEPIENPESKALPERITDKSQITVPESDDDGGFLGH